MGLNATGHEVDWERISRHADWSHQIMERFERLAEVVQELGRNLIELSDLMNNHPEQVELELLAASQPDTEEPTSGREGTSTPTS